MISRGPTNCFLLALCAFAVSRGLVLVAGPPRCVIRGPSPALPPAVRTVSSNACSATVAPTEMIRRSVNAVGRQAVWLLGLEFLGGVLSAAPVAPPAHWAFR